MSIKKQKLLSYFINVDEPATLYKWLLVLKTMLESKYSYLHFTDEETKAQKYRVSHENGT